MHSKYIQASIRELTSLVPYMKRHGHWIGNIILRELVKIMLE